MFFAGFASGAGIAAANPGVSSIVVATAEGLWRIDREEMRVVERIDGGPFDALAFGPDGNLYALSGARVREYDGRDYGALGSFVESPELEDSAGIAVTADGALYAARRDRRMLRFERDNPAPVSATFLPGAETVSGLALDADNSLLFSDADTGRVFRFDRVNGTTHLHFSRLGRPGHLATDGNGSWLAADNGDRPALVRVSGQDRWLHGFFEEDLPEDFASSGFDGAAIDGDYLVSADSASGAIVRFPIRRDEPALALEDFPWLHVRALAAAPLAAEPLKRFDDWLDENFSGNERLDPDLTAPDADPAGDGIANLLRFALGGDRKHLPRERLPRQETIEIDDRLHFEIHVIQARRIDGGAFRIESAETLPKWSAAPERFAVVSVENLDDFERVIVRDLKPIDGDRRRFYRLVFELDEK